jgi:hypothetical protein
MKTFTVAVGNKKARVETQAVLISYNALVHCVYNNLQQEDGESKKRLLRYPAVGEIWDGLSEK